MRALTACAVTCAPLLAAAPATAGQPLGVNSTDPSGGIYRIETETGAITITGPAHHRGHPNAPNRCAGDGSADLFSIDLGDGSLDDGGLGSVRGAVYLDDLAGPAPPDPEPAALGLLAAGLGVVLFRRRARQGGPNPRTF